MRRFRPIAEAIVEEGGEVDGQSALLTRTLLVHAYRRLVLREPQLPAALWPPSWPGEAAYEVAARCYHAVVARAEMHLAAACEASGEPLPPLEPGYGDRYPNRRLT